jgi:hypothetical protein
MSYIAAILIAVFCTPLGWIGMICFGLMVNMMRNKD